MQRARKQFQEILEKIENSGISEKSLAKLEITRKLTQSRSGCRVTLWTVLVVSIAAVGLLSLYPIYSDECFLKTPFDNAKIFREPVNCDMCINVTQIDKVGDVSPDDFEQFYSSVGKPVVITDGTKHWKAIESFSFEFFRNLYQSIDNLDDTNLACQFFGYKTEFTSLEEVFGMSDERARFEEGTKPWYVGWSNCNDQAGRVLREYYARPYFLPETSENIALSWIFMGGSGSGAHMHVDDVVFPSWQAQIRGRKNWRVAPPPECLYKCKEMHVTVEPGEIIVIDTNAWYHQTHILPGSISITIGSEFD